MANRVRLIATTFTDIDGPVTYGYRLFDDHEQTYGNCHESLITDDMELLQRVIDDEDERTASLLEYAQVDGLYVNGTWYGVNEITPIFGNKGSQHA